MEVQALNLYDRGDFLGAKNLFSELLGSLSSENQRASCLFNIACCRAALGEYHEAIGEFSSLEEGHRDDKLYNLALCEYHLGDFKRCAGLLDKIVAYSKDESSEETGPYADIHLQATGLQAAAQYQMTRDASQSIKTLGRLNVSDESHYDPVTLHNLAIFELDSDSVRSIDRLKFLTELIEKKSSVHVPSDTVYNFLVALLIKKDHVAFDNFLVRFDSLIKDNVSDYDFEYLKVFRDDESKSTKSTHRRLQRLIDNLRERPNELSSKDQSILDVIFSHLVSLLWHMHSYMTLEKLCESSEVAIDGKRLSLIQAHCIFMQDTRFDESARLFEKFLPMTEDDSLMSVDPELLGNLCVCYVLTGRNSEAEHLIKDIEAEELQSVDDFGAMPEQLIEQIGNRWVNSRTRAPMHLAIINAIIGTLYCVKSNYEFGLSRMFKSMEPLKLKLDFRLWFYLKRCILAIADCHCKQTICISDDLSDLIIRILIQCETFGAKIYVDQLSLDDRLRHAINGRVNQFSKQSVAQEARYLRSIILPLIHD